MTLNRKSTTPIFAQIINHITEAIEGGKLKKGDQIPSIQQLCAKFELAPGTVTKAYEDLRARGIILAIKGKGYYVNSIRTNKKKKILLLFDQLNAYKEILYNAFVAQIGEQASVNVFFHHYNTQVLNSLIEDNLGQYTDYVIMPHFNKDVSKIIKKVPADKLLLLDKNIDSPGQNIPAVFQNFQKDIYEALESGQHLLNKYKALNLVLPSRKFHYVPAELIKGFENFCKHFSIKGSTIEGLSGKTISPGEAFIVFLDQDLISLLKICKEKKLRLGKDIGLISYDDTPMKEVLAEGITVISTDFAMMGKTAARMVLEKGKGKIENPCRLIIRNTL
jgi:DNA-binding transcriptional regulator YhcF (GntR family)